MILINLIIHRGTHQIGGTCIELSTERTRIILDIGQELPNFDEDKSKKILELPKVKGLYRDDTRTIDAILISHGHGDHVGLIEHIDPKIPVFMGEKASKILNITAQFTGGKPIINPVDYLISGQEITVGDFSITSYLVDHSGFDSYAFVVKADDKCIVYTGDFRDHGRKKKATDYFRQSIPIGVDILLIEGTMMSRIDDKIETEEQIEQKAYEFMNAADMPIFVLQSATNIDRVVGMYRAAKRSGRIFVMDIFVAHIVSQLGGSIPRPGIFSDVRVFYPYHLTQRMFKETGGEKLMKQFSSYLISRKELGERKDYCMLIRDSMLSDLKHISNLNGMGMIYSMWSGYKNTQSVQRLLNFAKMKDIEVINLHTSGHASIKALQTIAESCVPKRIIPIHTERPNLFVDNFDNVFIANDEIAITI
ncbi:MAG: MBL fold metallo-hydrolase [Desulfosporosinus sp.]|nr:MBL fold metallo-hydrolase [Desulfosporosinus sp.]